MGVEFLQIFLHFNPVIAGVLEEFFCNTGFAFLAHVFNHVISFISVLHERHIHYILLFWNKKARGNGKVFKAQSIYILMVIWQKKTRK